MAHQTLAYQTLLPLLAALAALIHTTFGSAAEARIDLRRMEEGRRLEERERPARQRQQQEAHARLTREKRAGYHHKPVQHGAKKRVTREPRREPRKISKPAPRTKAEVAQAGVQARLLYHDQATFSRLLNALRILKDPRSNQFTRISTQTRILHLIEQLHTKEYKARAERILTQYKISPATLKQSARAHFAFRRFTQLVHRYKARRIKFKTKNITTPVDGRIAHELLNLYDKELDSRYKAQADALLKRRNLTIQAITTIAQKHPQQKSRTPAGTPRASATLPTSLQAVASTTLPTATQALGAPAPATNSSLPTTEGAA